MHISQPKSVFQKGKIDPNVDPIYVTVLFDFGSNNMFLDTEFVCEELTLVSTEKLRQYGFNAIGLKPWGIGGGFGPFEGLLATIKAATTILAALKAIRTFVRDQRFQADLKRKSNRLPTISISLTHVVTDEIDEFETMSGQT